MVNEYTFSVINGIVAGVPISLKVDGMTPPSSIHKQGDILFYVSVILQSPYCNRVSPLSHTC